MHSSCAENVTVCYADRSQTRYRFGNEKGVALFHSLTQVAHKFLGTATDVPLKWHGANPYRAILDHEWKHGYIVSTLGETSAGGEIKTPVVPVATEDAIFDGAL
jgi:hypothetical protein